MDEKVKLLAHWCVTDFQPAIYDVDSATAIEQTAKVYAKMQELVTAYNTFVDNVNKHILEFEDGTNKSIEVFQVGIRQEFQDFIDIINLKIKDQDKVIADAVTYMKEHLVQTIKDLNESGELNEVITSAVTDVEQRLLSEQQEYESNLTIRQTNYETSLTEEVNLLKTYVTPEMFGAVGDGITDDTQALKSALLSHKPLKMEGVYAFSETLYIYNDIYGGELKFNSDNIGILTCANDIEIINLHFNVSNYTSTPLTIIDVNNIIVDNCRFFGVGNDDGTDSCGAIHIKNSNNITIRNNSIVYCHTSVDYSTYGINAENCDRLFIENNSISDIYAPNNADGIKIMGNRNTLCVIRNNTIKNSHKRCIKMKDNNIKSENNLFLYENATNLGNSVIEFQRGNNKSIGDRLHIIITDTSINTMIDKVFGVNGKNVTIDNFNVSLFLEEGCTLAYYENSTFIDIYKNIDGDAEETADNLRVSNVHINTGFTRYFIYISNSELISLNNMILENITFKRYTDLRTYCLIQSSTSDLYAKCNRYYLNNFKYIGTTAEDYSIFQPAFNENVDSIVIARNISGVLVFRCNFRSSKDIVEVDYDDENVWTRFKGYRLTNSIPIYIYSGTENPTDKTTSAFSFGRKCPIGSKFLLINPIYNGGKLQIGWVCVASGDSSKVGTCVPLYENIETS